MIEGDQQAVLVDPPALGALCTTCYAHVYNRGTEEKKCKEITREGLFGLPGTV